MAYFNELPNLEVVSRFPNQSTNQDYTTIKNLWKRPKLREDIANAITAFNYYQIKDGERPDQIAERIYGDPELDWVILITNNITNLNEQWPLDNNSFYNYLIDKYGSEEALQEVHHTETVEELDSFNRLVIPGGLQVDSTLAVPDNFETSPDDDIYQLNSFLALDANTEVKVNLIQALNVNQRLDGDNLYLITDINIETSNLKVYARNNQITDININNNLINSWPSGWGGVLTVYGRDENVNIEIEDILNSEFEVSIPPRLYEVVGELIDDKLVPVFRFRYIPQS